MRHALPLALALIATPAAAADSILPGYWESTNKVWSGPIRDTEVERRCITPAEVAKFMSGPSNRHYTCTYPTKSFTNGKIVLDGTCVSKKGRQVAISGTGNFTETTLFLTADIKTKYAGIPLSGHASTQGRRIAATCPPGSKGSS